MHRRSILFATDFSVVDKEALQSACRFADAWKAKILIAHIVDSEESQAHANANSPQGIRRKLQELFPHDIEIDYEYVLRKGRPAKAIKELAIEFDVDLIVLGTHGRKGIQRMFAGSIAEKIIRSASCPVLTLRQGMPFHSSIRSERKVKVLVPTDFSVQSYAALDFASIIAHPINAGLTILYVDDSPESGQTNSLPDRPEWREQQDQLWQKLQKIKPTEPRVEHGHKMLHGPAAKTITEYANDNHYDYIILGTHGRSGVGRALLGSVAEQVVRNADCAVITVKPTNKRHLAVHG